MKGRTAQPERLGTSISSRFDSHCPAGGSPETIVVGPTPDQVYGVVKGEIPKDLLEPLTAPFTSYERDEIFHHIGVLTAEVGVEQPIVLWVVGPPAVGKSTVACQKGQEIFGHAENAVLIDGSSFREVHKGFQMVTQHGLRNQLLHAEAWKLFKGTGLMDQMKEEVLETAVRQRQHLRIPETCMSMKRVNEQIAKLTEAGYRMHLVCLWAPKSETLARGLSRSVREGKLFTTEPYDKSTQNSLGLAEVFEKRMREGDPNHLTVSYYDNTVFPSRLVNYSEFRMLVNMTDESASNHAKMCKLRQASKKRLLHVMQEAASNPVLVAQLHRQETERLNESSRTLGIAGDSVFHNVYTALHRFERQCGQFEGFAFGIAIALLGMGLTSYLHRRRDGAP